MKKILMIVVVILAVGLTALPVYADITDAKYIGTISIVNTDTDTVNVSVPVTISTANLISNYYIDSDCANTSIQINGVDTAFMPARTGQTDWILWAPTVTAGTQVANLYTGGPDMTSKLRYFPGTGGMATADSDDLELLDSFTIEQRGFVDTSMAASKYLVYKQNAFKTYVSATGTITSQVDASFAGGLTVYFRSHADATSSGGTLQVRVVLYNGSTYQYSAWQDVNTVTWTTYNKAFAVNPWTTNPWTLFEINSLEIGILQDSQPANEEGRTVQTSWLYATIDGYTIRPNGVGTANEITNVAPGGSAHWSVLDETSANDTDLVGTYCANPPDAQVTQKDTYTFDDIDWGTVSVAPVASAEHTVKTYADGTWLMLSIDGDTSWDGVHSARVDFTGLSVPLNSYYWTFIENDCMPYLEYQKIWSHHSGASLEQEIRWQNGATFIDLTLNGHNATPTWRTASSDPDVSANLTDFQPLDLSEVGAYSVGGDPLFFTTVPTTIPGLYDEGSTSGIPGASFINTWLTDAGVPIELFWYPIAFTAAIVVGFIAYRLTKQLLIQAIVSGVVIAIFCGGGVLGTGLLPWWTVIVFGIEAIGVLVIQDRFALG